MRYVPHLGIHWAAEIAEEMSKPPKYTAEAVLGVLEEFELGLRTWYDGVRPQCVANAAERQYVEQIFTTPTHFRKVCVCCR